MAGGVTPGPVLGSVRKQAEQATGHEPGSSATVLCTSPCVRAPALPALLPWRPLVITALWSIRQVSTVLPSPSFFGPGILL